MARLRLEHGTILPLEPKSAVIEDGTVVIDGANIAFVGPASQAPVDPDDEVIDCRGCAVMPARRQRPPRQGDVYNAVHHVGSVL